VPTIASHRQHRSVSLIGGILLAVTVLACQPGSGPKTYEIIRRLPHDPTAFTQGLVYADGQLFESTGRLGQSQVRELALETGDVIAATPLPDDRFGEGLALLDGRLYQLTWTSEVAYVYDAATLAPLDSFGYTGEGWGLATDGTSLIMSDGTATLRFRDPATFAVVREVTVRDGNSPLTMLNELEYARGELYANVYPSDYIVRIDPASGAVREWIDLSGLLSSRDRTGNVDVLNGIAFDERTGHFLVTGKLWPVLFEIRLDSAAAGDIAGTP
jgi:glutamine cyclotransferase